MSRTTLDIDAQLIEELKHMAAQERESMSKVANRLLREALHRRRAQGGVAVPLSWNVVDKGAPVDGFDPATRDYLDLMDEV